MTDGVVTIRAAVRSRLLQMSAIEAVSGEDVIATPSANAGSCRPADPLALDPLSPIALRPARFAAPVAPADPLALDSLGGLAGASVPRSRGAQR